MALAPSSGHELPAGGCPITPEGRTSEFSGKLDEEQTSRIPSPGEVLSEVTP